MTKELCFSVLKANRFFVAGFRPWLGLSIATEGMIALKVVKPNARKLNEIATSGPDLGCNRFRLAKELSWIVLCSQILKL
jgi:hypothetical protein